MKVRSTDPYWLLKNGLLYSYPSLQKNMVCDVLIIGAGITGALLAYQLSSEGYNTMLVDKRDVAMGSTAATTAMLQYEIDKPLFQLIEETNEDLAVECYRAGVVALERLGKIVGDIRADSGFAKKQSVYFASSKKDREWLEKEFAVRKKFKFNVAWLSALQLRERYGVVAEGGILSEDGASVDGYHLAHSLIAYCVKHFDLQVFDGTEVESVKYQQNKPYVTTDGRHIILCDAIVYASGYETAQMLKKEIVNLNSTYALVSEPLSVSETLRNTIFWNTDDPYFYMRLTSDSRILVGGGDEKFKNPILRDSLIHKKETLLLKKVRELLPDLQVIPDFSWAGTFGVTKDALPYIGPHPDFPNCYFVLGFGGNGITFSVMGMQIISDALSGTPNKLLEYFRFNR